MKENYKFPTKEELDALKLNWKRYLLPAISVIVFAWACQGEGDSWFYSFFYGCFVTFALLLPSYIKLRIKGYICYGLVLLVALALFLYLVKGVYQRETLCFDRCRYRNTIKQIQYFFFRSGVSEKFQ